MTLGRGQSPTDSLPMLELLVIVPLFVELNSALRRFSFAISLDLALQDASPPAIGSRG